MDPTPVKAGLSPYAGGHVDNYRFTDYGYQTFSPVGPHAALVVMPNGDGGLILRKGQAFQ